MSTGDEGSGIFQPVLMKGPDIRHGCGIVMICWGRVESPLMPKPPFIQPREVLLPMPTPIKLWILMYCSFFNVNQGITFQQDGAHPTLPE